MVRREAERVVVLGDIAEAQHARVADQSAEDTAAARQVADPFADRIVDTAMQEALEAAAGLVEHAQGRVACPRDLDGPLQDRVEQMLEVELCHEVLADAGQPAHRRVGEFSVHAPDSESSDPGGS